MTDRSPRNVKRRHKDAFRFLTVQLLLSVSDIKGSRKQGAEYSMLTLLSTLYSE